MFIKNRKKRFILLIIVFVALVTVIILCATASITPLKTNAQTGKCFSVSFDKQEMKTVNRIEITDGEKQIEITDPIIVDSMVKETMVATHIGTGCSYDRKIDLYCNNALIRTMYWSPCCDSVCVYDADETHWVFSSEGSRPKGYIYLSRSLVAELNKLLA